MNILLANDHAGTSLKKEIKNMLESNGYNVKNLGCDNEESVDYPDYAHPLAEQVAKDKSLKGIIICGSGIGVSMVANKHNGVRSALCWSKETAKLSRSHNNANVLSLPARFLNKEEAIEIVETFLKTEFEGGRHERRVDKINKKNT